MIESEIIKKTIHFVKKELAQAEGGHDWFHVERVSIETVVAGASASAWMGATVPTS